MSVNPWTLPSSILILCFPVLLLFPFTASAINEQGQALLSWKLCLNDSNGVLSDWDPNNETPCEWFGITCNKNRQVVEVIFKNVNLPGELPWNFSMLLSLNKLVFSGVNLTGSIPKEIGVLSQLQTLDLSGNGLIGEIPSEIYALLNLQQLYLNSNLLDGSIPAGIGNLTNLKELILVLCRKKSVTAAVW